MRRTIQGDHAAFPTTLNTTDGLSKREYFAAMALQGVLASHEPIETLEMVAKAAVDAADALIRELEARE